MSFEHLDDPNPPPQPSGLVVARIMAEGGRRLRHRRYIGSGVAAALIVGALGVSSRLTGYDDDKVITATPDSTTPTRPTRSEETTTTTAGEAEVGGADQFAAIIQTNGNALQVVLADVDTGRVQLLTEIPLLTQPWGCCIAWSPDRQTVYYMRPAGEYGDDHDNEESIFAIAADGSGEPEYVTRGWQQEISPDGASMAYIRAVTSDVEELVLRDLASGSERAFEAPQGMSLGDLAWVGNGSVAYTLAGAGEPQAAYVVELDGSEISLADGRRYGPPDGAPVDTRWGVHDNSDPGRALSIIEQTPTEVFAFTADADGGRQDVVPLFGQVFDASTDPSNTRQLLLLSATETEIPSSVLLRHGASEPTPVPLDADTILAIDW